MGKPRKQKSQPKPSPLQQVQYTRPLSTAPSTSPPEMGLVRDPEFWKRFSVAAHQAEEKEISPTSTADAESGYGDQWLTQQHKEKRRCRILCASITVVIAVVITGGAVVAWWFTKGRN